MQPPRDSGPSWPPDPFEVTPAYPATPAVTPPLRRADLHSTPTPHAPQETLRFLRPNGLGRFFSKYCTKVVSAPAPSSRPPQATHQRLALSSRVRFSANAAANRARTPHRGD